VAAITFDQVSKRFGDTVAVDALDLEVADGEFLVLVGPSGCGKTTALRMLAGLESVTDGRILIGDRVVNDLQPGERDIAMVFQSYALYPHMSVFDNLAFGLRNLKVGRDEIKHRVGEVAAVLELEQLLDRKPRQLSGGQRQRVALGRSIVREPSVFLMDEPLSNLDAALRVQTRAEILKLQRRLGTTTIYVTHDQVEAMTMGDRIAVMRDGILQQIGTPVTLYTEPVNTFVARFIGSPAMNLLPAPLLGLGTGEQLAGIRPEHVSVVMADDAGIAFEAQVEVVEYLGDEQLIHAVLRGHPLLAKLPVDVPVPSNGVASFTVATDKVRLFDATSGSALEASAPADIGYERRLPVRGVNRGRVPRDVADHGGEIFRP
jgi:multiple sugar transport system ATP-binding protein